MPDGPGPGLLQVDALTSAEEVGGIHRNMEVPG